VVCAWIGNSEDVAQDHYLQMRDEYFDNAATSQTGTTRTAMPNPTDSSSNEAVQNPVQSDAAASHNDVAA
jgi:hypothetical protein